MSASRKLLVDFLKTDIKKSLRGEKRDLLCTISQIALCLQPSSSTCRIWKRKSILWRPGGDLEPESSLLPGLGPASLLKSVLNPMVGSRKESGMDSRRSPLMEPPGVTSSCLEVEGEEGEGGEEGCHGWTLQGRARSVVRSR